MCCPWKSGGRQILNHPGYYDDKFPVVCSKIRKKRKKNQFYSIHENKTIIINLNYKLQDLKRTKAKGRQSLSFCSYTGTIKLSHSKWKQKEGEKKAFSPSIILQKHKKTSAGCSLSILWHCETEGSCERCSIKLENRFKSTELALAEIKELKFKKHLQ